MSNKNLFEEKNLYFKTDISDNTQNENVTKNSIESINEVSYKQTGQKRKISRKNNNKCSFCNKEQNKIFIFKKKEELIEKIHYYKKYNNNNRIEDINTNKNNQIISINQNYYKFIPSQSICLECFIEISNNEKLIKKFFFKIKKRIKKSLLKTNKKHLNKKRIIKSKSSASNNSNFEEIQENSVKGGNEVNLNDNKVNNNNIFIDINEFISCFDNIKQYLRVVSFELCRFIQNYILCNKFIDNIIIRCRIFIHYYLQAKYMLQNLYMTGYKLICDYRTITNKIVNNSKELYKLCENKEELKNNIDNFINNTNSILNKLLDFFKIFNLCLELFK